MSKQDAYDLVTARIIEALEAGIVPWHRPWKTGPANGPRSLSTGKPYQGVNVWVLEATAALRGYESRYWTTFKQAKERGGSVRKGEKGTAIVFWKFIEKTNAEGEKDRIPFLRYFTVFNLDQCDDVAEPTESTTFEPEPFEPIAMAERIAAEMPNRPNVNHGGDRAYYSPMLDYVQMPLQVQFETPSAYYSTLFHELTHSTAHASRLNRKNAVANNFGDESYSREELCAEMGAAFLCGFAGIDVRVSEHASYIGSWLKALKDDRKLVVSAAGAAQKAADYILGALAKEEGSDDSEPSDLGHSNRRIQRCTSTLVPGRTIPERRTRCASTSGIPAARATGKASFAMRFTCARMPMPRSSTETSFTPRRYTRSTPTRRPRRYSRSSPRMANRSPIAAIAPSVSAVTSRLSATCSKTSASSFPSGHSS